MAWTSESPGLTAPSSVTLDKVARSVWSISLPSCLGGKLLLILQDPEVRCHLFLEAFQVSPGISPTPLPNTHTHAPQASSMDGTSLLC